MDLGESPWSSVFWKPHPADELPLQGPRGSSGLELAHRRRWEMVPGRLARVLRRDGARWLCVLGVPHWS